MNKTKYFIPSLFVATCLFVVIVLWFAFDTFQQEPQSSEFATYDSKGAEPTRDYPEYADIELQDDDILFFLTAADSIDFDLAVDDNAILVFGSTSDVIFEIDY